MDIFRRLQNRAPVARDASRRCAEYSAVVLNSDAVAYFAALGRRLRGRVATSMQNAAIFKDHIKTGRS